MPDGMNINSQNDELSKLVGLDVSELAILMEFSEKIHDVALFFQNQPRCTDRVAELLDKVLEPIYKQQLGAFEHMHSCTVQSQEDAYKRKEALIKHLFHGGEGIQEITKIMLL